MIPIKRLHGFINYGVCTTGDIVSFRTRNRKVLKTKLSNSGNVKITLRTDSGDYVTRSVARLVAEAFIPNPHNKTHVVHINNDKSDNRVENLKWGSLQEIPGSRNRKNFKFKKHSLPLEINNDFWKMLCDEQSIPIKAYLEDDEAVQVEYAINVIKNFVTQGKNLQIFKK